MGLFEQMTGAHVRDCIVGEEEMIMIVREGDMGLAIGKKGETIENVREKLGKKIAVVEHSEDMKKFVGNLLTPAKVESIELKDERIMVKLKENSDKKVIRNGRRMRRTKEILKRHYGIDSISII